MDIMVQAKSVDIVVQAQLVDFPSIGLHYDWGLLCLKMYRYLSPGPEQLVGSVLGLLSSLMQHHGFNPPLWRFFFGRGDFPLGVDMSSDSIPPKTLWDESINQGLVCAHMHSIDFHVLDG